MCTVSSVSVVAWKRQIQMHCYSAIIPVNIRNMFKVVDLGHMSMNLIFNH